MLKITLRVFGERLFSSFNASRMITRLMTSSIPKYSFCVSKPPGDHSQHSGIEGHSKPHHEPPQHNHHHHHHDGQPCNHDHSHDNKQLSIPPEHLHVNIEEHSVQGQGFQTFSTRDSISILDKIAGNKASDSQELLVLMFTCNKCETRAIRSFTKNAYENGVVLIKCEGCENIHLIADNLGWFEDERTNVETMKGIKRIEDMGAVKQILNKVFEDSEKPLDNLQPISKEEFQIRSKRTQDNDSKPDSV